MSRLAEMFWKSILKRNLNYHLSLNVIHVLVMKTLTVISVMRTE